MPDGDLQPVGEVGSAKSAHTPAGSCHNVQAHDFVPGHDNSFRTIVGLVDVDGIIGWRPLNVRGVRSLAANGGPLGTFINDFNWLCRAGRPVPSRQGRRQVAMALAVGIGPRLNASRRAGPRKTNAQR